MWPDEVVADLPCMKRLKNSNMILQKGKLVTRYCRNVSGSGPDVSQ